MTFTANGEGGKYTETLTVNQIPNHNHKVTVMSAANEAKNYGLTQIQSFQNRVVVTGDNVNDLRRTQSTYTGNGEAHNNISPYIVVYVWKRIS